MFYRLNHLTKVLNCLYIHILLTHLSGNNFSFMSSSFLDSLPSETLQINMGSRVSTNCWKCVQNSSLVIYLITVTATIISYIYSLVSVKLLPLDLL